MLATVGYNSRYLIGVQPLLLGATRCFRHVRDTPVASQGVPPAPATPNGATDAVALAGSGMPARVVPSEEPWLTEAGARLREGKLVAFPTG